MSDTGALVYVVDDDPSAREGVARLIRSAGLMTKTFGSGEEFLAAQRPKIPSCLVLDVNLPGVNGLDLQHELEKSGSQLPIIFLTGHGDIPMAVRAVRAGAASFLTKPVDDQDLLNAITQSIGYYLEEETGFDQNVCGMVGESPAFQEVLRNIRIVAPTDATVLVYGETGTGKELIARAIHDLSGRSKQPFIKVNCAAIPATLLESELFGHEKGSFTGAFAQKLGRFELAHKGTLFLDEIGEIPLELQSKLLRAIQEQELERLGGNRTIHVDIRLVAATNRNLKEMVDQGKFRSDLYYRLHVFPLTVPPLRERQRDIPLLIRYFAQKYAKRLNREIEEIPTATIEALTKYAWPGNIRELQHIIERSVILTTGRVLHVAIPQSTQTSVTQSDSLDEATDREQVLQALVESGGKVGGNCGAAARLGVPRTTLQARMKKLNIKREYC